MLYSARSALYSCLRISDFASASNCSLVFPKMILVWQLSNSRLDLRFVTSSLRVSPYLLKLTVRLETNLLFVSDKPATGSHLLLAPEGTVVRPANSWCARRQSQHLGASRRCRQGSRLSGHSSPGRMKLLPQSLQSIFFLKVPRPLTRDFSCKSSMSRIFLIQVSRRARFCSDISSWGSNWSRLDCSHPVIVWSISIRWESKIIPVNSWILLLFRIGLKFVLLDLRSDFSKNLLFFVFQGESWFARLPGRDLISVFETNLNLVRTRVSPYLFVWKRTELVTNFLHQVRRFFSLLSEQLVKIALFW